jgi:hypothetical protein
MDLVSTVFDILYFYAIAQYLRIVLPPHSASDTAASFPLGSIKAWRS